MDVMSRQLQCLIQAVNIRLVCVILMIFTALKTGLLSWSLKQLFAAGSTIEVNQKLFKQDHHMQGACTIEQSLLKLDGCD